MCVRDRRERIRSAPANANVQRNESSAFSPGNIMAPSGTEYPMFMVTRSFNSTQFSYFLKNIPTTPAGGLAVPSPNAQSYVYKAPGLLVAAPLTCKFLRIISPKDFSPISPSIDECCRKGKID